MEKLESQKVEAQAKAKGLLENLGDAHPVDLST
jgi:hypothetical protein